jgi:hypothetical protein
MEFGVLIVGEDLPDYVPRSFRDGATAKYLPGDRSSAQPELARNHGLLSREGLLLPACAFLLRRQELFPISAILGFSEEYQL